MGQIELNYQVSPLRVRVDLGAIAMKGYSTFPKALALLESHHQIVSCHIRDNCWRSLLPLQKYSRCILQPQSPADWGHFATHIRKVISYKLSQLHQGQGKGFRDIPNGCIHSGQILRTYENQSERYKWLNLTKG